MRDWAGSSRSVTGSAVPGALAIAALTSCDQRGYLLADALVATSKLVGAVACMASDLEEQRREEQLESCGGCRDSSGVCHGGGSDSACGTGGGACADCTVFSAVCDEAACAYGHVSDGAR
jgi:hypothetical protein